MATPIPGGPAPKAGIRVRPAGGGAVLVVRGYYGPAGGMAVVREVMGERLRVDHANWLNNGEISTGVPPMTVAPQ